LFKPLDGDMALLLQGGVFKPAELHERDGKLFARAAGGFVRLYKDGRTSKTGVSFTTLVTEEPLFVDRFGRLCLTSGDQRTPLAADETQRLTLEAD
jgi:hypothetical protein